MKVKCIKHLLAAALLSFSPFIHFGQNVTFNWAKSAGGSGYDGAYKTATTAGGNLIVAGSFVGQNGGVSANFSFGAGTPALPSFGGTDIYFAKYSNSGTFQWAKSIGGVTNSDQLNNLSIDQQGNILISGAFQDTFYVNPANNGNRLITANGSNEAFVAKYDSSGNYLWAHRFGTPNSNETIVSMSLDGSNNIYLMGIFKDSVDFDPSPTAAFYMNQPAANGDGYFLLKLDPSGNFVWAKQFNRYYASHIVCDQQGNVYVTGSFPGATTDFDPGPAVVNLTYGGGSRDAFLAKYDASGNYKWAKRLGGANGQEYGSRLALSPDQEKLYATGTFQGTQGFYFTTGIPPIVSNGSNDIWLTQFDTAGNYVWGKSMGSTGNESPNSLKTTDFGELVLGGMYGGTMDFNPGAGVFNLTPNGFLGAFVAKYSDTGAYIWAGQFSSPEAVYTSDVALFGTEIFACGAVPVTGSLDADPGAGTFTLTSVGEDDAFVVKLTDACPVHHTLNPVSCDSFTYNGTTYHVSGTYYDTILSATACDSFITLNVTINNTQTNTVHIETCDSVVVNGITYHTTGNYTQNLTAQSGCDSIVTYDVIIKGHTQFESVTHTSCGSYTYADSTYANSGTYLVYFQNQSGCDSIVTLNLMVEPAFNATLIQSGAVLTASGGDSYQWINCADNSLIAGANNQSYTVMVNGSYAAIVTSGNCSDTTDCIEVKGLSINGYLGADNKIEWYPNPVRHTVTISTSKAIYNAGFKLLNVLGQVNYEVSQQNGDRFTLDLSAYANGIYWLEITEGNNRAVLKIVKQ